MIVDAESMELVSAIEEMIEATSRARPRAQVKPELMQSVLEISTNVCRSVGRGGRPARGPAAPRARDGRGEGPHDRLRRHPPVREVGGAADRRARRATTRSSTRSRFVARQELLFGLHVHVGIDDPEKAIHVANGMRVHLPILLALSANSPFWRGVPTGLMSTRTPIFKPVPRVGVPPRYESWADFQSRVEFMVEAEGGGGLHLLLVGRAPAPEPRHGRDPRLRRADPARAHDRARGPDPGDVQGAGRALRGGIRARHLSRARCSRRTSGWPRATASRASWSTCPQSARVPARRARPAAGRAAPAARPRARLPSASSRRSRTWSSDGTGARAPARRLARGPGHARARAQDRRGDSARRQGPRRRLGDPRARRT